MFVIVVLFWVEFWLVVCFVVVCQFSIPATSTSMRLLMGPFFFDGVLLFVCFFFLFAANVFGTLKKQTGFTPYVGAEGFKLEIPSKWNPSREVEFPGQVLRFEDNFDATNNLSVSITPSSKSSIKDYGSPEDFLASVSSPPEL
jgi:hypothetical protein